MIYLIVAPIEPILKDIEMKIEEIYEWLFNNDPVIDDTDLRVAWANMASYCYFINLLDFDAQYRDKLKAILEKSLRFNITVPDSNHQRVIELAKRLDTIGIESPINLL